MPLSHSLAVVASLALVAGLASIPFVRPAVLVPPASKEHVVYFKYMCRGDDAGVRQQGPALYGPGCMTTFIWQ